MIENKKKNAYAVALGSIKSEKKARASRENGKKGGRPKTIFVPTGKLGCSICQKIKEPKDFWIDKTKNRGRCSYCKECGSNRIQHKDYLKRYAKEYSTNPKNKQKILARKIITKAIRDGDLVRKPCIICGNIKSEGHHSDYTKPLDVIWLCDLHHRNIHRDLLV